MTDRHTDQFDDEGRLTADVDAGSVRAGEQTIASTFDRVGSVRDDEALERNHLVKVEDGLAYSVGKGDTNTDGNFAVVDVYPPTSPTVLGSITDLNDAQTVLPLDDYAYVGDGDGLHAIDVSDPTDPTVRATVTLPHWERINAFTFKNGHILAANKSGYLHAIDVRRPAHPRGVGTRDLTVPDAHGVGLYKQYAVVANSSRDATGDFIALYDVFDPSDGRLRPPETWEEEATLSASELRRANRVNCQGTWAFVTSINRPSRFCVVDLSDPTAPSLEFSTELEGESGAACQVAGPRALVGGGGVLEVWDVSDPTDPARLATGDPFDSIHDADIYGDLVVTPSDKDSRILVHSVGSLRAAGGWVGSLRLSKAYVEESATVRQLRVQDTLVGPPGTEFVTERTVTPGTIAEQVDAPTRSHQGRDGVTADTGEQWVEVPAAADHETRLKKIYPGNISGGTIEFEAKFTGNQSKNTEYVGLSDEAGENALLVTNRDGDTQLWSTAGGETTKHAAPTHDLTGYHTYRIEWFEAAGSGDRDTAVFRVDDEHVGQFDATDGDAVPTTSLFFVLGQRTAPDDAPDASARTVLRDGPRVY